MLDWADEDICPYVDWGGPIVVVENGRPARFCGGLAGTGETPVIHEPRLDRRPCRAYPSAAYLEAL